jgi:hypothetical protein
MATTVYYTYINDFNSRNRFKDSFENIDGTNVPYKYDSLLSANSVTQYYKNGDSLKTINLDLPNFIELAVNETSLIPNSFVVSTIQTKTTEIIINDGRTSYNTSE